MYSVDSLDKIKDFEVEKLGALINKQAEKVYGIHNRLARSRPNIQN